MRPMKPSSISDDQIDAILPVAGAVAALIILLVILVVWVRSENEKLGPYCGCSGAYDCRKHPFGDSAGVEDVRWQHLSVGFPHYRSQRFEYDDDYCALRVSVRIRSSFSMAGPLGFSPLTAARP